MNEWISVKDRLPENAGKYLAYGYEVIISHCDEPCTDAHKWIDALRIAANGIKEPRTEARVWIAYYSTMFGWDACPIITHWMPLPEPPESEDDAE